MSTQREILSDLTALRDEARIQLHLLSMDAKARWQEFEPQLESLMRELDTGAEKVSEATAASARRLTQDLKSFFRKHDIII